MTAEFSTPGLAGLAGAIVSTHVTFAPCFVWIFVGAPYMEWLRGREALSAALSTTSRTPVVSLTLSAASSLSR